jgi:hypothetical protein
MEALRDIGFDLDYFEQIITSFLDQYSLFSNILCDS